MSYSINCEPNVPGFARFDIRSRQATYDDPATALFLGENGIFRETFEPQIAV
jgi:hypothetical protein